MSICVCASVFLLLRSHRLPVGLEQAGQAHEHRGKKQRPPQPTNRRSAATGLRTCKPLHQIVVVVTGKEREAGGLRELDRRLGVS